MTEADQTAGQDQIEPTWVTGPVVDRSDLAQFTHVIRSPTDPGRSARDGKRRADIAPHRTLNKLPKQEVRSKILNHLLDGTERTFNRIGVELWDLTADVLFTTQVNDVLWELVADGLIEHTLKAPVLFRRCEVGR